MKSKLLIVGFTSLLWLQPLLCSAQNQASVSSDVEALKWVDEVANSHDPDLLFKALWYTEPLRAYQQLELYTTGMAYRENGLTNRPDLYAAFSNWSEIGVLTPQQLNEIRGMLTEVKPAVAVAQAQAGQKYIAFVYSSGSKYVRYDFVGQSIPSQVESIIEKVSAEISAQPLRHDKLLKLDPSVISHPCAKREGDDVDLEAMPAKELFAYAGRRSLLPLGRYRAVKCYFNKSPAVDNNDNYMVFLKRWVESFEKADK